MEKLSVQDNQVLGAPPYVCVYPGNIMSFLYLACDAFFQLQSCKNSTGIRPVFNILYIEDFIEKILMWKCAQICWKPSRAKLFLLFLVISEKSSIGHYGQYAQQVKHYMTTTHIHLRHHKLDYEMWSSFEAYHKSRTAVHWDRIPCRCTWTMPEVRDELSQYWYESYHYCDRAHPLPQVLFRYTYRVFYPNALPSSFCERLDHVS